MPSGKEQVFDMGFNLYLKQVLKFSFHYIFRNRDLGDLPQGSSINNYYFQSGVGAIQRGNWFGLGIVVAFKAQ